MPQLDSLLRIVDAQGADELRLGSDKSPSMFGSGAPKKLTIPATSTASLLELFGDLLDEARRGHLERLGRVELAHEAASIGSWKVVVTRRPGESFAIDAVVTKASAAAPAAAAPAALAAPRVAAPPIAHPPAGAGAPAEEPRGLAAYAGGPLSQAVEALASRAIALGASDLHLADGEAPAVRIDGRLRAVGDALGAPLAELLAPTLGEAGAQRLATGSSVDLGLDVGGSRARVNVYRTARGLAAAIRFLARGAPALADLGFPVPIDDLALLPQGLVLTTGATGSGKSTTLAAIAREAVRRRSIVLVTLEDPIEHLFEASPTSLVRQRQIGRDVSDFHTGLRDALREDPDVMLIGEMRDQESISLALTAAETGHLVLASLHARSASTAVERIVDAYPAEQQGQVRLQLADALRAVIAQRLLPRQSGTGRALAAEVLRVNTAVASAIREGKTSAIRSAMQSGKTDGMMPLERHLADLVRRGAVTHQAAREAAADPDALGQYLRS